MNDLIAQLLELTGQLEPAAGVAPESLAALRRLIAAILIQQNPGFLPVVVAADEDAAIAEAALAGEALATERTASGIRSRFIRQPYLDQTSDIELPAEVLGPFIDATGRLVQFRVFDVASFMPVTVPDPFNPFVHELPMLLPPQTTGDAGLRNFTIPAGTVWIRGERVLRGAAGYAVLRVAGGSLELDVPAAQSEPGAAIDLPFDTFWRLTLGPEQPSATPEGSDGNGLSLQLPAQLVVQSDGAVTITGEIGMAGFGSELRFETPLGGPHIADQGILFSYDGMGATWSIDGNRSELASFVGESVVPQAMWMLPRTETPPEEAFEAAHGGSLLIVLEEQLTCRLSGVAGSFTVRDTGLLANALGLHLRSQNVEATARFPLSLWGPAKSDFDFGADIRSFQFVSLRDGTDVAALLGGRLRNRWDLPHAASGEPFGFDGTASALVLMIEREGLRRIFGIAHQPGDHHVQGVALENFYLQTLSIRDLVFVGSGTQPAQLAEGRARLLFDVQLGEPMLPDPYAVNWPFFEDAQVVRAAFSITLTWQPGEQPIVRAQLEKQVSFPEPRDFPEDSDPQLRGEFMEHLQGQPEFLNLLDLSTGADHFGIALESLSDSRPRLDLANRLSVELREVRLLMQPQVHWEPVQVGRALGSPVVESKTHGGQTVVGANSVKLVPTLPGVVSAEIVAGASVFNDTAALFSLPFGLRALVFMDPVPFPLFQIPAVSVALHQPDFDGDLAAAKQLRLIATGGRPPGRPLDPARIMPGRLRQTSNLFTPNDPGLTSVLPSELGPDFQKKFEQGVPLHAVDLSGYGLSCFSDWHIDGEEALGVTQVRFDVVVGRTSYEVIKFRTVLAPCQARVVRTIVMERRNSGRVQRFDSGWVAIDDGTFDRYFPFETGLVRALRRIRNIRILPQPILKAGVAEWQPVRFDADGEIGDVIAGGNNGLVPALDHSGYVQTSPDSVPDRQRFVDLFKAVGGPIGGAIDCRVRVGKTLDMQLCSLFADLAPADDGTSGFAVAIYGTPTLPRAGQWSAVRIDGKTSDVSVVDARRGLPVVRRPGRPCTFRDAADARRDNTPVAEYGLLLTTPASRVLFPKPKVDPNEPGRLRSAPPLMADPVSLLQASSAFPRSAFALRGNEAPLFEVSPANEWRLDNPNFSFIPPLADVASGADWTIARGFPVDPDNPVPPIFNLQIDSAAVARPWEMLQPPDKIDLTIPGFGTVLTIDSNFAALSDALPGMQEPTLIFGSVLDALKDMVNALEAFIDLPFKVEVHVTAGQGPSPSFIVHLNMKFRIGEGADERIDIGLGKFYGEFELTGELETALKGDSHGRLKLEFQGDIQQGILPPVLYAGGLFRFALEIGDTGHPVIELGLGTTTSLGGDLIKDLLEVEATIKYGYMLVPETLKPGVILGIEARAKLLAGLFALSFSADAMARVERLNSDDKTVRIFADIRVAGRIQVAVFFKKSVDFHTQFEQNLPLAPLLIAGNVNPLVAVAVSALI
jgi:hypothetical protein